MKKLIEKMVAIGNLGEEKSIAFSQINKAVKRLVNDAKWVKELDKLGVNTSRLGPGGFGIYIEPVLTAIIVEHGGVVTGPLKQQAKMMCKSFLSSLTKGGDAKDEDIDALIEAIGESLIDRMVKAMVEAPQFQKLLKGAEKHIEKKGMLNDDLMGSVKNALVMTLTAHDASLGGSLAGKAKRETKKAVAAG